MTPAKTVVAPGEAVHKAPSVLMESKPAGPPRRVVMFWKKMSPFEKIVFSDGSTLVFGQQTYATADEVLIKQIEEVAERYGILKQSE